MSSIEHILSPALANHPSYTVTEALLATMDNQISGEVQQVCSPWLAVYPHECYLPDGGALFNALSVGAQEEVRRVCGAAAAAAVPRPPPVQIPQLPAVAAGGGPVTPPAFQAQPNAPPAPRANRRRPILNPEEESDEDQPNEAHPERVRAVTLANNALNMPRAVAERWKLLENAAGALRASHVAAGILHDTLLSEVHRVLREEHGR